MIELKNLSKTYLPNKETEVHALKDINLTLGNKGLVFLLGKSGSGKTTLLNMIGGLDKPTQGQIIVDGKELDLHKEKEINAYRNNKVGFIFQNYGLLEDLTVKDNVKIALEMQDTKDNKQKIQDVSKALGLSNCIDKKVSQLSGGQKQRVAIARALIKNSQIILADEPTGNLDEKNSKEIFEILQVIAKHRLVIVVTHSQKFAYEYAQRIISLEDGKIKNDKIKVEIQDKEKHNLHSQIKRFPVTTSIRLAFNNIKHTGLRFFLTLVFLVLSLTMFGAGLSATRYSKYDLYESAIKDNNIKGYTLVSAVYIDGKRSALQPEQLKNVQDNNTLTTYFGVRFSVCYQEDLGIMLGTKYGIIGLNSEKHFYPDSIAVYDADKLMAQDIRLIKGQAPVADNEIVITRYFAEGLLENMKFREIYGVETMDDMVGKSIACTAEGNVYSVRREVLLKISGIVDTHINYDRILSLEQDVREKYTQEGLHCTIFATEAFLSKQLFNLVDTRGEVRFYKGEFSNYLGKPIFLSSRRYVSSLKVYRQSNYDLDIYGDKVIWIDGHDKRLKENEILVSSYNFGFIYNNIKNQLIFTGIRDFDEKIYIEKLNEGIECEVTFNNITNKYKVVGFIDYSVMVVSDNLDLPTKEVEVKSISSTFDKDNIQQTLRTFEQNEVTMTGDLYEALQKASDEITPTAIFGILGFAVFGLFAVMMLTSFMSSMIEDNYKQLGVLRALGASRGNLIGIYLLVATILVVLCNIIAMPMLPLVKGFMQPKEIGEVVHGYIIFETMWYDYIIMLALSAVITFGASITHILTKTKATPIEMLKGKR